MKTEYENIEDLFKGELEDLGVHPDAGMEDQIAEQIDFPSGKTNRIWVYLLILGLLLVGGCVSLLFPHEQNSETNHFSDDRKNSTIHIEFGKEETHWNKPSLLLMAIDNSSEVNNNEEPVFNTLSIQTQNTTARINATIETNPISDTTLIADNGPTILNTSIDTKAIIPLIKNAPVADTANTATEAIAIPADSLLTERNAPDSSAQQTPEPQQAETNDSDIDKTKDKGRYKHTIGLGTFFSISTQPERKIEGTDTSWSAIRNPAKNIRLNYSYNLFSNVKIQSGFEFESSSENWERSTDSTGTFMKDTIIDGELITYTYEGTFKLVNKHTYQMRHFSIPLVIGYQFNIGDHFGINLGGGGILSGTFVRQHTTYLKSKATDLTVKENKFNFSPRLLLGASYTFKHFGLGLSAQFAQPNLKGISLFEQNIARKNIGMGLHFYYQF